MKPKLFIMSKIPTNPYQGLNWLYEKIESNTPLTKEEKTKALKIIALVQEQL